MKRVSIVLAFLLCSCMLSAQDIITKRDGTDIQAKVTEVGQSTISYKKYSNLDGPLYTISISDIVMITYENGEREMYISPNTPTNNSTLPQGVMTYYNGKVSVGGVTIENEMLKRYFTAEDYSLFKNGKSLMLGGGIVSIIGSVVLGYSSGWMITGGKPLWGLLIGGGVASIGGLIVCAIGEDNVREAVNNYNFSLAFQPEIRIGTTTNGIGLVVVF